MALLARLFLAGSVLYLSIILGDASSFSELTNVVTDTLEKNVPARAYANVYGHGRQLRRQKREVTTKHLDDPKDCIRSCDRNETDAIVKATTKNVAQLISMVMAEMQGSDFDDDEAGKEELKRRVEEKTINNLGPLFADLCKASKDGNACMQQCPQSKLREISLIDHVSQVGALCEPSSSNWKNFKEYYVALNCTNATESDGPCDGKCGKNITVANATGYEREISESTKNSGQDVTYETDSKKNDAKADSACKNINCHIDCYKSGMTDRCGAKGYDLYVRMTKLEPRATLSTLKALDAIGQPKECKFLQ